MYVRLLLVITTVILDSFTVEISAQNPFGVTLPVENPPSSVKDGTKYTIVIGEHNEFKVVPLNQVASRAQFKSASAPPPEEVSSGTSAPPTEEISPAKFIENDGVRFELYTSANPLIPQHLQFGDTGPILPSDYDSIKESNFDPEKPTRMLIHGWRCKGRIMPRLVRAYFIESRHDVNFVVVDWRKGSNVWNYFAARQHVLPMGDHVAKFIEFMSKNAGLSLDTLTIIGYSLGAHVAGVTGKRVKIGKIAKIVGLDPAFPLFSFDDIEERLAETDASYVEVIHTNTGLLGFSEPIGHADFYPNGGRFQPGCELDVVGDCSHRRAYEYYIESIKKSDFYALQCDSFETLTKGNCSALNNMAKMGGEPGDIEKGIFYLQTNSGPIWSKGLDGAVHPGNISYSIMTLFVDLFKAKFNAKITELVHRNSKI